MPHPLHHPLLLPALLFHSPGKNKLSLSLLLSDLSDNLHNRQTAPPEVLSPRSPPPVPFVPYLPDSHTIPQIRRAMPNIRYLDDSSCRPEVLLMHPYPAFHLHKKIRPYPSSHRDFYTDTDHTPSEILPASVLFHSSHLFRKSWKYHPKMMAFSSSSLSSLHL